MLKELLDLELSEVSGGNHTHDVYCEKCGGVIAREGKTPFAIIRVAYRVTSENNVPPRIYLDYPAVVHNNDSCINDFINLKPEYFEIITEQNFRESYTKVVGRTGVCTTDSVPVR